MTTKESVDKRTKSQFSRSDNRPYLIAGPCSAETEEQVLHIARELSKDDRVRLYRAGIWKPRTRPGSFEGVGAEGLPWLQAVKAETGLKLTVEVAKAEHVELCLEHGIDVLWIGARTTVNPFAVQEIADALKGVDVPVLVKNPINPDMALWMGSVERILAAGVPDLAVIHRGFSHMSETYYRNKPIWQLPIAFQQRMPDIPIICDPSHICGRRDILREVAQKAMDLNFDGLMIETHHDPDNAWSDARQQITPAVLRDLMTQLTYRQDKVGDQLVQSELDVMRAEIAEIDSELYALLSSRMKVVQKIGAYKKDNGITILQKQQWAKILSIAKAKADSLGLSEEFFESYLEALHDESIRQQEDVMNKD